MYRVKGLDRYIGSCMMYDFDKEFFTRFFAKRFYAKKCKECDFVILEERLGPHYVELDSYIRTPQRTTGYIGNSASYAKERLTSMSERNAAKASESEAEDDLKTVVYDVDDTMWSLNGTICEINGIDLEKMVSYKVLDNDLLTDDEKNAVFKGYGDVETFKRCKFYDGVERIFDLDKAGLAHVWISSANLSDDIRNVKLERLANEVPNINMEQVRLTVGASAYQGRVPGYILVDDSLHNIRNSNFEWNILIDMPHNRDLSGFEDKNIVRAFSLAEAVDMVEKIIKEERGIA